MALLAPRGTYFRCREIIFGNLVGYNIPMRLKILFTALFLVVTISSAYGLFKPLPDQVNYQSPTYRISAEQIEFLTDTTFRDDEAHVSEQTIFDRMLSLIDNAHNYVLLDLFLFNNQLGKAGEAYRPLSTTLAETLVTYKTAEQDHQAVVITDHINTAYGSYYPKPFQLLQENQIPIIFTNLAVLRDSNPLYSGWYRAFLQFLPDFGVQWLPNPFDPNHPKTTLGSYWRAFNFKANHRKTMLTNSQEGETIRWHGLVTSLNPHDGSSRHSNVAVVVHDHPILNDLFHTEAAVVDFSSSVPLHDPNIIIGEQTYTNEDMFIQLVTEKAIKRAAIDMITETEAGDQIDLAMFYLSDRDIVNALKAADARSVQIRILLDPNRDAFGREKNGIPNRPVAHELMQNSNGNTTIRWCATSGEQCHSKLLRTEAGEVVTVLAGSANFTRRNLENYNLETALRIQGTTEDPWQADVQQFFLDQWNNAGGRTFSVEYDTYADDSWTKTVWYRIGEFTGMSHY